MLLARHSAPSFSSHVPGEVEPRQSLPCKSPKDYTPHTIGKKLTETKSSILTVVQNKGTLRMYVWKVPRQTMSSTTASSSRSSSQESSRSSSRESSRSSSRESSRSSSPESSRSPTFSRGTRSRKPRLSEFQLHTQIRHPKCVPVVRAWKNGFLLPLKKHDLFEVISKTFLGEVRLKRILRDVAEAVEYLHANRILHRDIKPENIFLDEDGTATLGDFGLSLVMDKKPCTKAKGSLAYMAPEVLAEKAYSFPADIWSLGVVMYACFMGDVPYDPQRVGTTIIPHPVGFKVMLNSNLGSPEARRLMRGMLTYEADKRLTAKEVLASSWFTT